MILKSVSRQLDTQASIPGFAALAADVNHRRDIDQIERPGELAARLTQQANCLFPALVRRALCISFTFSVVSQICKNVRTFSLRPNQFVPGGCFLIGTHSREHLHAPEWCTKYYIN